jgi:hypothetical protein
MRLWFALLVLLSWAGCDADPTPTPVVAHEGTPESEDTAQGDEAAADDAEPDPIHVRFDGDLEAKPEAWTLVLSRIIFVPEEVPLQIVDGFNLDGLVSDGSSEEGCYQADLESTEGEPGIDNHFASILPVLRSTQVGAVETLIQNSIDEGTHLLFLELSGVEDRVNDDTVTVRFRTGYGDALLGTDGMLLAHQTFNLHADSPDTEMAGAEIIDGVLHVGPFDCAVAAKVFGVVYELPVYGAMIRATLSPEGGIEAGLLGGGIPVQAFVDLAEEVDPGHGQLWQDIQLFVSLLGDWDQDGDGECELESMATRITGIPAYFFSESP